MSFSDQRTAELLSSARADGVALPPTDAERRTIGEAINQWSGRRRERLDALLVLLGESSREPQIERWRSKLNELRDDLAAFCKTNERFSAPVTAFATDFVSSNGVADTKFVDALVAASQVMEARDQLTRYLYEVTEETRILETKWSAITAVHGGYAAQELAVMEQVDQMVRTITSDEEQLLSKAKSALTSTARTVKDAYDHLPEGGANAADLPLDEPIKIVGTALERWRYLTAGIDDQASRLQSYLREEVGGPLLLFEDFRKETQKFIDDFSYEALLKKVDAAKAALDAFVGQATTSSANGADASTFATAARVLLQGHMNSAQGAWDKFVEKHKGKFFGPLSPDFSKALLDRELFQAKYERLQADNLARLASQWRSQAREVFSVDFSGIPAATVDQLKAALRPQLEAIDELLRRPLLERIGDNLTTMYENATLKKYR